MSNAAPMLGGLDERLKQGMVDATALGRTRQPEKVEDAIVFLASEEAPPT